ncbi:formyltetrahydrofolate deformylase [Psychrobium sp. MM17-31]|uniref:formyltetrahydrofolate deformylase n=1 Tax=Psychrobium sp. MM17-31 TaxID=2917758 RepID=UPI001EF41EF8|nr:formyltetrahydrofolate deformylase [Psychrobium sp. MM17-31]MCG7531691.1 formyltetrahydrofolate deformylase [Psychrobium sp. MM17-31]
MNRHYRLVISCPDQIGIVSKISQFIAKHQGSITEANHHTDVQDNWFFMRHKIAADTFPLSLEQFRQEFTPLAKELNLDWSITDSGVKNKVILMCSKESHCLVDILNQWHSGDLDCDISCVISNHPDFSELVKWYGIPYHHVPVTRDKSIHFNQITELIDKYDSDTVVLARYMQILPSNMCDRFHHQIINIHHSFLPSFVGAKPYHQAYNRGVKLIGATCHYVTQDLDEGPIIEQDVARVSHRMTPQDMVRLGKDVEKRVLSNGLRMHLEGRVIVHDNKTIILD